MQSPIMAVGSATVRVGARRSPINTAREKSLFERVGGRATLERVHAALYDDLYRDAVLGQFFVDVPRDRQQRQLTDFMAAAMGGPKSFVGKPPHDAHRNMFITDEMFVQRHRLLAKAIRSSGVPGPLVEEWLRVDASFRRVTVKASVSECRPRYPNGPIVVARPVP